MSHIDIEIIDKLYNLSNTESLSQEEFNELKRGVLLDYEKENLDNISQIYYLMIKMVVFPELQAYSDYLELNNIHHLFGSQALFSTDIQKKIHERTLTPEVIKECFSCAISKFELDIPVKDLSVNIRENEKVSKIYETFNTLDKLSNSELINNFLQENMTDILKEVI